MQHATKTVLHITELMRQTTLNISLNNKEKKKIVRAKAEVRDGL